MADDPSNAPSNDPPPRSTICIAGSSPGASLQQGDPGFEDVLAEHYPTDEAHALDGIVHLKDQARQSNKEDFWRVIAEGLVRVFGAQWGFTSKRVERDEETGEPTPPIGEHGSCLTGISWYYDDGNGVNGYGKNILYYAWANACSFMKHNKVVLVPDNYASVFPSDPNAEFMPMPFVAYLAVPLFANGNPIGHLGLIWSKEGIARRRLSWSFIEAGMHALEDLVSQRLVDSSGLDFSRSHSPNNLLQRGQTSTSLKPYAQTLSHELRTPMQGVVGMLDLMHTNVEEFSETQADSRVRKVLKSLRDDIEVIQDSSRRAVEAAENVAHAYDLDMGVPSIISPALTNNSAEDTGPKITSHSSANLRFTNEPSVPAPQGTKRKYSGSSDSTSHPRKTPILTRPLATYNERQRDLQSAVLESGGLVQGPDFPETPTSDDAFFALQRESESALAAIANGGNGLQYSKIRELVDYIVNESLRIGGRPQSTIGTDTEHGRIIEAIYVLPDGESRTKTVECFIDSSVPEIILVHEKNLAKLVSCVFQNALKFTEHGRIDVRISLDANLHAIVFLIQDTGRGIHHSFRSRIFRPFSKEDNSLSRGTEGLGLGLLVAKGLSRRLGGDLRLVRSETEGPQHGSEFEIRIPVFPTEVSSPTSQGSRTSPERHEPRPTPAQSPRQQTQTQFQHPPISQPSTISKPHTPNLDPPPSRDLSPPRPTKGPTKNLAATHPLTFLVAEDNFINRKLLVSMLVKLGYDRSTQIYEAYDGADAVRQATEARQRADPSKGPIDIILMDLWMPSMDGYEATERILSLYGSLRRGMRRAISEPGTLPVAKSRSATATMVIGPELGDKNGPEPEVEREETPTVLPPTIMAVTADATDGAAERAVKVGMDGVMAKPFKLRDLEKLVRDGWGKRARMVTGAESANELGGDGAGVGGAAVTVV